MKVENKDRMMDLKSVWTMDLKLAVSKDIGKELQLVESKVGLLVALKAVQ